MMVSWTTFIQVEPAAQGMTTSAWVFMLVAWTLVLLLTWFCFRRIFRTEDHFDPDGLGPEHSPVPPTHEEE